MAGQTQTSTQEAPDFGIEIQTFYFPATLATNIPLIYAEKDLIIDEAFIRTEALDSSNVNLVANLYLVADTAALTTGTIITTTGVVLGTTNGAGYANKIQNFVMAKTAGVPNQNILKGESRSVANAVVRGRLLVLRFDSAPHSSLGPVFVQVRYSSIRK